MRKFFTYLAVGFLLSLQTHASNNLLDDPCLIPSDIEITEVTTYSVDFEWTYADTNATLFQYTITAPDEDPLGGPTTTDTQASSVGYNLLTASTTYNLYLRTMCMGVWSDWSDPVSFTTVSCDAVDMPYLQEFETLTSFFNLVECTTWEVVSGNYWNVNQAVVSGFDGNTLSYSAHETQDAESWYIFENGINIESGDKIKVSFNYASNGNGTENLRLLFATNIEDFADGTGMQIANLTFDDDTVNQYVAGPIPVSETGVYYFGFQAMSAANQGVIYVDDFQVENWVCGTPAEIEISNIQTTEATLSWVTTGENTTNFFQYIVSTEPIEPSDTTEGIVVTGTTIGNMVEDLEANTTYYVYVRASCSGVWSDWSEAINFTTLCDSVLPMPTGETIQNLVEGETLADLEVEGENLTWYADEALTTEIEDTTVATDGAVYYVTQSVENCVSDALAITVTVIDPCADITAPTGNSLQTLAEGQTLADLDVAGTNLTWYADMELTTELPDTTEAIDDTTYYVTQTIDGCQSEALVITVEITLSVGVLPTTTLKIYPNPANSIINIVTADTNNLPESFTIYNTLGQMVKGKNITNSSDLSVDISSLAKGVYFIKVNNKNQTQTLRFIKQ